VKTVLEGFLQEDAVQGSSVVAVLTLRVLQLLVCYRYSNRESVITNCSYDLWAVSKSNYQSKPASLVTVRHVTISYLPEDGNVIEFS
jgi:hypothetical protein